MVCWRLATLGIFAPLLTTTLAGCFSVCADPLESTGLGGSGPSCSPPPTPTGGAGGAGGSSGRPASFNGCTPSTAVDNTAEMKTTIAFEGVAYNPRCIRVKVGTIVTFAGDFEAHPLWGAYQWQGGYLNDDKSPFPFPPKSSGMSLDVTMPSIGSFPYVCTKHNHLGMIGAVIVEPR